jgi:hypothetical protein
MSDGSPAFSSLSIEKHGGVCRFFASVAFSYEAVNVQTGVLRQL